MKETFKDSGRVPTLFIDFDGPFNTPGNLMEPKCEFHQSNLKNLLYFVREYKAKVCVISAWRFSFTNRELFLMLNAAGCRIPEAQQLDKLYTIEPDIRGPLIRTYCKENEIKLDEILIIDDDSPEDLMDRWVDINFYDGFTFGRAMEAIRILNGEPTLRGYTGGLLDGKLE